MWSEAALSSDSESVGTLSNPALPPPFSPSRVACYLSDDAASMLTFEAVMETANFARLWVPFCRKHQVEPRAPEMYFAGVRTGGGERGGGMGEMGGGGSWRRTPDT